MASAFALGHLAEKLHGIRYHIAYGGIIGRTENQLMAKSLRLPLHPLTERDLKIYTHLALLDTQPPFHNNPFPDRRRASLVIDHHPRHIKTNADFVWIDESVGATSTLMTEALQASQLEIPSRLATALAYGIISETQSLGRQTSPRDVDAYLALIRKSNTKLLSKIQNPARPRSFFRVVGHAIENAFVCRSVIGVHLGSVPTPDHVSHMADFLLTHEKMVWSICTGRYRESLHVSLRSRSTKAKAGSLLRKLLGGAGGGHKMMAGGIIPMLPDASDDVWQQEEKSIAEAILRALGHRDSTDLQFPFREETMREQSGI